MSTPAWRRLLLSLCAFEFLLLCTNVWMEELHFATLPGFAVPFYGPAPDAASVRAVSTTTPKVYELTFPAANPLARAGIRSGDLLDLRGSSPAERYRWATKFWWAGEPFHATIVRGSSTLHVTLIAQWLPLVWYGQIANAGVLWMLLFAALLAWRRPDDPEARTLSLLLIVQNIGISFESQNWLTPWPLLDATLNGLSWPVASIGIVLLTTYAMLFARPPNVLRRALARASYAVAAVCTLLGLCWPLAAMYGTPLLEAVSRIQLSDLAASPVYWLPVACLLATIPQTRGAERARIIWASIPLVPLYVFNALPESLLGDRFQIWVLYGINVSIFLTPLGLTYSLLSRRLLDVGFALNRAAVFAVTSLLLAGLFAGLQWAANAFLSGMVRVHNVAVDMAIVVVVYYAMRVSRHRTDAIVSRLFFAARNRRLEALREIAGLVDGIADAESVAPVTVEYLRTRAGIEAEVIWQGSSELRALAPSVEFPMRVRGQLRGVLICRPPDDAEFAPDEMFALEQLAVRMATDRDDLLAESLRVELDAARSQLRALRAAP